MKVLIIYFTMSGRTKKTAKAIGSALKNHEMSYLKLELTGKFIEKMEKGVDMVMGNRLRGVIEKGAMPFLHRYIGTPLLTSLVRLFFKVKINDINCGMRGMTRDAFLKL